MVSQDANGHPEQHRKQQSIVLDRDGSPGESKGKNCAHSDNPLERLNKEIKRRTYELGVCPDGPSVIHLVGPVLIEIADEWQVTRR